MVTRGDINGGNISLSFLLPSLVISFFRSKLYLRKKSVESWRKKTSHKRGLGLKIREGGGGVWRRLVYYIITSVLANGHTIIWVKFTIQMRYYMKLLKKHVSTDPQGKIPLRGAWKGCINVPISIFWDLMC